MKQTTKKKEQRKISNGPSVTTRFHGAEIYVVKNIYSLKFPAGREETLRFFLRHTAVLAIGGWVASLIYFKTIGGS